MKIINLDFEWKKKKLYFLFLYFFSKPYYRFFKQLFLIGFLKLFYYFVYIDFLFNCFIIIFFFGCLEKGGRYIHIKKFFKVQLRLLIYYIYIYIYIYSTSYNIESWITRLSSFSIGPLYEHIYTYILSWTLKYI